MRAPDSIRVHDLVAGLIRDGGGHEELEGTLTMDAPLQETLGKVEAGLRQGFGDLTLADMVAVAPAEKTA